MTSHNSSPRPDRSLADSKERKHKSDAQRLREYLRLAGLSQIEAAREWDISERTMRYYCSGRYPVPKVIMLLAEHTARKIVTATGDPSHE